MKLKPNHPALSEARSIHTGHTPARPVSDAVTLLRPVNSNAKVGKGKGTIQRGKWKGFRLFSLTLEERKTCPPDCLRWAECFGNAMPFAARWEHGPNLEARLRQEVAALSALYPSGFAVRLHILGDFYSQGYVELWGELLQAFPSLHVYGYTARHDGIIAKALDRLRLLFPDRWRVRVSRNFPADSLRIYASQEGTVKGEVVCPEQTGKVESCLDCGLCWDIDRTIAFRDHDKLARERKEKRNEAHTSS